jgi:hypothetical protein
MLPDYYAVLQVAPQADFMAIRQAYRNLAMTHHPDRGGSHEQMLRINEAWNILSNLESRAAYDRARASNAESAEILATAEQARRDAANYPSSWEVFATWVDRLGDNFNRTQFKDGATNTLSGWIFIAGGCFVAGCLSAQGVFAIEASEVGGAAHSPQAYNKPMSMLMIGVGGWMGAIAHKIVTKLFFAPAIVPHFATSTDNYQAVVLGSASSSDPSRTHTVLTCPHCKQGLRVPIPDKAIRVRCARCEVSFVQPPMRT